MAFVKALIIAILVTLLITYFLGSSIFNVIGYGVAEHASWLESMKAINLSALAALFFIIVASVVVFAVFGTIIFIIGLVFLAIVLAILGAFWPVVLVACLLYFLCRDKSRDDYFCS